jgi:predicted TIM-barrel fold metal-dependent hydrolase
MLQRMGWHLQWYAPAQHLPEVAALHAGTGIRAVLDHLGGLAASLAPTDPAWHAAAALARQGAWVKLSGWYRLGDVPPYAALSAHVRWLAQAFGDRMVWGSDWPHTGFAEGTLPTYESTWGPVEAALGPKAALALRDRSPALYD